MGLGIVLLLLSSVHHRLQILLAVGLLLSCAWNERLSAGGFLSLFLLLPHLSVSAYIPARTPPPSGRMLLQWELSVVLFQPYSLASPVQLGLGSEAFSLFLLFLPLDAFCTLHFIYYPVSHSHRISSSNSLLVSQV